ncbi:hypothetical protein RUND412_003424 [Rhizina undulata]
MTSNNSDDKHQILLSMAEDSRGQPPDAAQAQEALLVNLQGAASPPRGISEQELLRRLEAKRREIEEAVDAFRVMKEEEYRAFESLLRTGGGVRETADGKSWEELTGEGSGEKARCGGDAVRDQRQAEKQTDTRSIPVDLGSMSNTVDSTTTSHTTFALTPSLALLTATQIVEEQSNTSPPFEKELQAAGLFTPRYLPLLEKNSFSPRSSDMNSQAEILQGKKSAPESVSTSLASKPSLEKLATIPPSKHENIIISHNPRGSSSPPLPLASSLKSSSGSSCGTNRDDLKPKSPKKVSFQFEDENFVPSRSSPPPSRVKWTIGEVEDFEGAFDDVEEVGEDEFEEETVGSVEQVEDVVAIAQRPRGEELVVPRMEFGRVGDLGISMNGFGITGETDAGPLEPSSFAGIAPARSANGFSNIPPYHHTLMPQINGSSAVDTDDEDDLFDLDETIPEEPSKSPPHRDLSALLLPHSLPASLPTLGFQSIPRRYPHVPTGIPTPPSGSLPGEALIFGKSPVNSAVSGAKRSHLSSSFSMGNHFNSLRHQEAEGGIVSLLPISGQFGSVGAPGRFRRRSIAKYDIEENEEVDEGRSNGKGRVDFIAKNLYAGSLPMEIVPRFQLGRIGGTAATTSMKDDVSEQKPVSARPSPKHSPELETDTSALKFDDEDSAGLLADAPRTSPTTTAATVKDQASSYRRTSPFPSASAFSPARNSSFRNAFAADLAAAEALTEETEGLESVVGGVDGSTGLDPDVSSLSKGMRIGNGRRRGSMLRAGAAGTVGAEGMSFSARMAMEEQER